MPQKHYPDIAAARHMREPSPRTTVPEPSSPPAKTASASRDKRQKGSKRRSSAKPSAGAVPSKDKAYRRKRFIALMVSSAVCVSVPALIVLLVLFG